ncbi:MAG: hypothetical protein JWR50_1988 [Mucilaginibacter sp.]|nr:hypothetical protein [Mucilaginibacter sp.]
MILLAGLVSCKKEVPQVFSTSSLTIVNVAVNNPNLSATFTSQPLPYSQFAAPISYGSFAEFGRPAVQTPLKIVSSADTGKAFYQTQLNFKGAGIYSLYLASGAANKADAVLMQDTIAYLADSVAAVRFINMSTDSKPVSINLLGNTSSEFTNLAYKKITSFKRYSANSQASVTGGYTFEVRDAATGTLLTTFTWTFSLFKSNTLVIGGLENDSSGNYPVSVFQVNNY